MYHRTKEILEKYGYSRYEISNYAKDGYECRHNVRYWDCGDYIGFGLGAASLMKGVRYRNTPELPHYIEAYNAARTEVQELTKEEQMEEFMFLGLRMVRGVSGDEFKKRFSCEYVP